MPQVFQERTVDTIFQQSSLFYRPGKFYAVTVALKQQNVGSRHTIFLLISVVVEKSHLFSGNCSCLFPLPCEGTLPNDTKTAFAERLLLKTSSTFQLTMQLAFLHMVSHLSSVMIPHIIVASQVAVKL